MAGDRRLARRPFLTLAATALAGCAAGPDTATEPDLPVWPPPPEMPRFRWVATLRSGDDVALATPRERLRRLALGIDERARATMLKPLAVAARGGRIYVTDTGLARVHAFDLPARRYFVFGYRLGGELGKPLGLSVDAEGRVYVADRGRREVVVFDPLGLFLAAHGGAAGLVRPTDVAVDAGGTRLWIVDNGGRDSDAHRIVLLDGEGRELLRFGARGTQPGAFNLPVAAALSPRGLLYVLDAGNFRVQAFDGEGRHLFAFGAVGNRPGQFARPRDIACDGEGRVYVSDAAFGNVQLFDPEGRLLMSVGDFALDDRPGRFALLAGIAVDDRGHLYAVDQIFRKVEVFAPVSVSRARRDGPVTSLRS